MKTPPTRPWRGTPQTAIRGKSKDQVIDRYFYHRLYPGEATPCKYGLISSTSSVPCSIPKHLAFILALLVGNTLHHKQNSTDFVKKIQHLKMSPSETIVSFDVTSLFTCMPISSAVENQPHSWSDLCPVEPLPPHHLFQIQWPFLQTEARLCRGISSVPQCG